MDKQELFEKVPARKAVWTLALPTVISQLITVIYNVADTFFVGQLNDPVQAAAATVAMPPFIFLTGIANLFGIGGASLIARDLGAGQADRAKNASAFAIWTGILLAFIYGILFTLFRPYILPLMGTTAETYNLTFQYLIWTITVGAIPTVISTLLAHLIRTEGYAKQASLGLTLGGVLNIALDPLFIFGLHMELQGAAIATLLSNCISCAYFVIFVLKNSNKLSIRIHPKYYSLRKGIPREVLVIGLPSFIMTFMSFLSNVTLNQLIAGYSSEAVAGMGIAKKVDMVGFAVAQGMTQGVLALVGYNYSSGNRKRMGQVIKTTLCYSVFLALIGSVVLYIFANGISRAFIANEETVEYAKRFVRILCTSLPLSSCVMMSITVFQATGSKIQPLILSLCRKGGFDIPFMLLYQMLGGIYGIAWATPTADVLTTILSLIFFVPFWHKIMNWDKIKQSVIAEEEA